MRLRAQDMKAHCGTRCLRISWAPQWNWACPDEQPTECCGTVEDWEADGGAGWLWEQVSIWYTCHTRNILPMYKVFSSCQELLKRESPYCHMCVYVYVYIKFYTVLSIVYVCVSTKSKSCKNLSYPLPQALAITNVFYFLNLIISIVSWIIQYVIFWDYLYSAQRIPWRFTHVVRP